jgi:hypothetical protein
MTTLLDAPSARRVHSPADRLRTTMTAIRLSFTWFGTRKTLTPEQRGQAAEQFGAEGDYLSAGKKLLDTKHPAFKAVTNVRGRAVAYWRGISLPFPEPGIRLIRQDDLAAVNVQLTSHKAELDEAVWRLNEHLDELNRLPDNALAGFSTPPIILTRSKACSIWPGISPVLSRRRTCSSSAQRSIGRSASVCRLGSMKPCGWQSKPFWKSWPSWSIT